MTDRGKTREPASTVACDLEIGTEQVSRFFKYLLYLIISFSFRYLPAMHKEETASAEDFAKSVNKVMLIIFFCLFPDIQIPNF